MQVSLPMAKQHVFETGKQPRPSAFHAQWGIVLQPCGVSCCLH